MTEWSGSGPRFHRARRNGGVKQISVHFDRGPTAVSAARHALIPLDERLEDGMLDDITLMVSELVTNSVRHAADDAGSVGLDVRLQPDRVRVEVSDPGSGFEPKPREPGQSQASGWGLYLVDRLADRWGVMRGDRTNVWFEMDGAPRLDPALA
jgi:anti-sigma regulatory factor (Ser/Thr protein kinase)